MPDDAARQDADIIKRLAVRMARLRMEATTDLDSVVLEITPSEYEELRGWERPQFDASVIDNFLAPAGPLVDGRFLGMPIRIVRPEARQAERCVAVNHLRQIASGLVESA